MKIITICLTLAVATIAFASESSNEQLIEQLKNSFRKLDKPVTFTTPEMIENAKQRVQAKAEPWYGNYQRIKHNADNSLTRDIVPYTGTEIKNKQPDGVHEIANRDFAAARDCSIVWMIERDPKYLRHAQRILLMWAKAEPTPFVHLKTSREFPTWDADRGLMISVPIIFYCHSYSLIWNEFTPNHRKDIDLWLKKVASKLKFWHLAWTANEYYGNQYYNNHLSWHNAAIGYLGFVLQDEKMVAHAIDDTENPRDFKEMLAGAILMPGDETKDKFDEVLPGEIYDRYRSVHGDGLGYAMYHGMALCYLAEAAYNNGIDLYDYTAPGGENLSKLYIFYAEFIAKDDSTLRHGFYKGDKVPTNYGQMYDLMNTRYPGNREFIEVLNAHGRYTHHNNNHGATIGLTHSLSLED